MHCSETNTFDLRRIQSSTAVLWHPSDFHGERKPCRRSEGSVCDCLKIYKPYPCAGSSVQLLTSVQIFSRFSPEPNNLLTWIRSSRGAHLEFCCAVGKCPVRCSPWSHPKDKHLGRSVSRAPWSSVVPLWCPHRRRTGRCTFLCTLVPSSRCGLLWCPCEWYSEVITIIPARIKVSDVIKVYQQRCFSSGTSF